MEAHLTVFEIIENVGSCKEMRGSEGWVPPPGTCRGDASMFR